MGVCLSPTKKDAKMLLALMKANETSCENGVQEETVEIASAGKNSFHHETVEIAPSECVACESSACATVSEIKPSLLLRRQARFHNQKLSVSCEVDTSKGKGSGIVPCLFWEEKDGYPLRVPGMGFA